MTTTKHTPGPWKITLSARSLSGDFRHQIGNKEKTVAYTWSGDTQPKNEQHANAQLIAAAPETASELVSAKNRIASYEHDMRLLEKERDRLKITNRELLVALKSLEQYMTNCGYFIRETKLAKDARAAIAKATGAQ